MANKKHCIECKGKPANYWDNSFCYDCYKKLLSYCHKPERVEQLENEIKQTI